MAEPYFGESTDPNMAGIVGKNTDGIGVWGESVSARGVVGLAGPGGAGVWGETKQGRGVVGADDADGVGVWGHTETGRGVVGVANQSGAAGVWGETKHGRGVVGVDGDDGVGVWGESAVGVGVVGKGTQLAGRFEGDVEVTGDIRLTNADCAEDFDIAGDTVAHPGDVVVLGNEGTVHISASAYDKRVAGVISGAGDYKPGLLLDRQPSTCNRRPVALLGKVFCKVDAGYAPIDVGDMLTTSDTLGHAMMATDPGRAFGAVIGKALRPWPAGKGMVPILIAL